ncbi:hypothetical protein JT124_02080 [Helicobacter pylori]|nr:hypothetical protein [Helicobacter pylori]
MPLSVFHNQNKKACVASDSSITRSYGVRGIFKKGGCRGMISKNIPIPL